MINWFKKKNYTEYKNQLLNAFPKTLKSDVETVLNIIPFEVNNVTLRDGKNYKVDNLIHSSTMTIKLDNELLTIPYRLYFNEPNSEKEEKLTETQKTILNCIYLRHHDGYLRQRKLEELIEKNDFWVIPFKFQLLGEYVFEILHVLDKHINEKTIENYLRFVKENPKYYQKTESRMISYWNEYYRYQSPKLKDYIGQHIVNKIKKANS